jgi:hypothetical protein
MPEHTASTTEQRPRFHAAPTINRASILAHGLDPSLGVSPWDDDDEPPYPQGTYLWPTLDEAETYAWGLGDPFDIWEVTGQIDLQPDPQFTQAAYAAEPVPLTLIQPVLHVPGVNELWGDVEIPFLDLPVAEGSGYEDE